MGCQVTMLNQLMNIVGQIVTLFIVLHHLDDLHCGREGELVKGGLLSVLAFVSHPRLICCLQGQEVMQINKQNLMTK